MANKRKHSKKLRRGASNGNVYWGNSCGEIRILTVVLDDDLTEERKEMAMAFAMK